MAAAQEWFFVVKEGGIFVNAAGSIDQVPGRDVSFVVNGLERVAVQKLVG